jgi:hypothetical protein
VAAGSRTEGSGPATPVVCSLCGRPIVGEYARYEELDLNVCRTCQKAARCASCSLPMAGFLVGDGTYCSRCIARAPRCAGCGRPIFGNYREIVGTEGMFCERCSRNSLPCALCGAPAPNGQMRAGRFVCRSCRALLIEDAAAYDSLYAEMIERAQDVLGLEISPPPLDVVSAASFDPSRLAEEISVDRLSGLFERRADGEASILILTPQTSSRAAAVMAHELGHAWQARHCPDAQGTRIREGFAEWVSWKLLAGLPGGERERERIEARRDDYGWGFRIFRGIEERGGIDAVLWYAQAAQLGELAARSEAD